VVTIDPVKFSFRVITYVKASSAPLLFISLILSAIWPVQVLAANEELIISLSSDVDITVERFGENGRDRVLLLPSEYGYGTERRNELARGLAANGFEVWQAAMHEAYFQPVGRKSLTMMPVSDVAELIQQSMPEEPQRLFVLSAGRGAALIFMALKEQLAQAKKLDGLAGVLLLHPNFMVSTPQPGRPADYLPVVSEVSVPTFIVQPMDSAKRWYLAELVDQMAEAGTPVYSQLIPKVSDGYQGRPDATDYELKVAKELPRVLARATRILSKSTQQTTLAGAAKETETSTWSIDPIKATLQEFPGNPPAPLMALDTVSGDSINLGDYRGKVVLINFWATWCPPCVEEIPSLGRLQEEFSKDELVVLSVDVGEPVERVREFLQKVPAAYPVMLDPEGETVSAWNLRAFPTTFVIDAEGRISLSYFGGLDWDAPDIVEQLRVMVKN